MGFGWIWLGGLSARTRAWLDRMVWLTARGAVDAVRYQPRHLDLVVAACGTSQPGMSPSVARWLVETRAQPAVVHVSRLPHAMVRTLARQAARWFGPTASAVVRFFSGALAAAADHAGSLPVERRLVARVHPGLLVPHLHVVAVLAVDMRGFSKLTGALEDTQYLAELIEIYLTELTEVVERDRGVVFQYTGDGLLALFLPELAGVDGAVLLDRLVNHTSPALHGVFDNLYAGWRTEWRQSGRPVVEIGLGAGLSFGRATIGFIGPSGKKQFGALGEPVNLAAFLGSEAGPGTSLVDCGSFRRAGAPPPPGKIFHLRSRKQRQRVETLRLYHGGADVRGA